MKKANTKNLIIITITFIIAYVSHFLLAEYKSDLLPQFTITGPLNIIVPILVYVVFLLLSVVYATRKLFCVYIKHEKDKRTTLSHILIFVSSIIVAITFLLLNVEYYFYFGSVVFTCLIYFALLYLYDINYVKSASSNKITINDTLVNDLLIILGGNENIINVTYEASRLKVETRDVRKVNLDRFKKLGASGIFVAGNKLQAIIGNNARELEIAIKRYLSNV